MRITWKTEVKAPGCPGQIEAEDGRILLAQINSDWPGIAGTFGWKMRDLQRITGEAAATGLLVCDHDGTDGTVDCDCGVTADSFIDAAREYLEDHDGATAEDPGYFPAEAATPTEHKALTEERAHKYLKGGGANCPFCGAQDVEGESITLDDALAGQRIWCTACERHWFDTYTLTSVSDDDGEFTLPDGKAELLAACKALLSWADNPASRPDHTCGPEGTCDCDCAAWGHYQQDRVKAKAAVAKAEKGALTWTT